MTNDRVQPRPEVRTENTSSGHQNLLSSADLTSRNSNDAYFRMTRHSGSASDNSSASGDSAPAASGRLGPQDWHRYSAQRSDDGPINERSGKNGTQPSDKQSSEAYEAAQSTGMPVIKVGSQQNQAFDASASSGTAVDGTQKLVPYKDGAQGDEPKEAGGKGEVPEGHPRESNSSSTDTIHRVFDALNATPNPNLSPEENQLVRNIQNTLLGGGDLSHLQSALKQAAGNPAKLKEILSTAQANLQAAGAGMSLAVSGNNVFIHDNIGQNAVAINPADGSTSVHPITRENGQVVAQPGEVLNADAQQVMDGFAYRALVQASAQAKKQSSYNDVPKVDRQSNNLDMTY